MFKRSAKLYIEDIKDSIKKIESYTGNLSFDEFKKDTLRIDAVVRNLTIIGEAEKNIPEGLKAYLVPLLPIGTSPEHLSFRGTVSLTCETLKAVVADVVDSLVKTGFKTIILVSLHGGNYVLWSDFIPQLEREYLDVTVLVADLQHAWDEAYKVAGLTTPGMHADECDASLIASLRPDLVGPNPVDFPISKERLKVARVDHTGFPLDVRKVSPSGALGEPSKGNKEKGGLFWSVFLKLAIEDVRRQARL